MSNRKNSTLRYITRPNLVGGSKAKKYSISYKNEKKLRAAAAKYGASESELATWKTSIDRLVLRKATDSDLDHLRGLAALACVRLPGENQHDTRSLKSVHDELRRNA